MRSNPTRILIINCQLIVCKFFCVGLYEYAGNFSKYEITLWKMKKNWIKHT